jgi:hypothetical protein
MLRMQLESYRRQAGLPSNARGLSLLARFLAAKIPRIYQKTLFVEQWSLLFDLNGAETLSFGSFRKLIPPKDRFWADPHVVEVDGRYFIFVEEYMYRDRKAHISVIEMDGRGNYQEPVRVLERDHHLSYPFVFRWQGRYYMVPESVENRTIEMYKCVEFPHRWQFERTLMENVNAVDTTLLHHEGRWWLFTGMARDKAALPMVELFLFFSDDLFTDQWVAHPLNPVNRDVARARPAGRVFIRDGRIFRPSQDCSRTYGYGFYLNEVLALSRTEYLEETVVAVRPDWDKRIKGTHTFARAGQLTMVDAFTRRSRFF